MSQENNDTPQTHAVAEQDQELHVHAKSAFQFLLWTGLILVSIGVAVLVIGWIQAEDTYGLDAEILRAGAGAGFFQWSSLGAMFLVGAGIVSGLGRRKTD